MRVAPRSAAKNERRRIRGGVSAPALVRLSRLTLWTLIALAALGGMAGLVRQPSAIRVSAEPSAQHPPLRVTGFAEAYVVAFLESEEDTADAVEPFVGHVDLAGVRSASRVVSASAVEGALAGPSYWAVLVAVVMQDDAAAATRTRYYSVGVVTEADEVVAAGLPALVAAPRRLVPNQFATGSLEHPDATDPVASAAERFAAALLAGDGELARYTSAGSGIDAVTPPPFDTVRLEGVAAVRAGDGLLLRALIRGERGGTAQRLQYELRLVQRDGQWVVASVSGAPTLATNAGRARPESNAAVTTTTAAFDPLPPTPNDPEGAD